MQFSVDHIIILHDDLAAATEAATKLGFLTTPTGHHGSELGTQNTTLMLPDRQTYIELLAIDVPTERNGPMREALARRGPHIFGIAFKGNADRAHKHFVEKGIDGGPPFHFERPVDGADGPAMARFTVAPIRAGALPGLYAFVCDQLTPENVWLDRYLTHPNGAQAMMRIAGVAKDPEALRPAWASLAGDSVSGETGTLTVTTPTTDVQVAAGGDDLFTLQTVELSADLGKAHAALSAAGVAFEEDGGGIDVADTTGFGAAVRFIAA